MVQRQVEKVVAAQLLEATKGVLDHVSRWQNHLSQRGESVPPELAQVYGRVRRLREYLHRLATSTYTRQVPIDLNEQDENLLASCALHHVGVIELQLQLGKGTPQDRAWLEGKRTSLARLAIALATRPITRIPSPDVQRLNTPTVREVIAKIARDTARIDPTASVVPPSVGGPSAVDLLSDEPVEVAPVNLMSAYDVVGPAGTGGPAKPAAPPGAARAQPAAPAPAPAPRAAPPPDAPRLPLDPQRMRDPRLRAMLSMDLAAFESTAARRQYRLSMVHLSSILEAAVVDYALPRQKELAIRGLPEGWKIEQILDKCMGDRLSSMDRPCVLQMVAARHLVRPAVQLNSPMAVTAATVDKATDFVRRVLLELGYVSSGSGGDGGGEVDLGWLGDFGEVEQAPAAADKRKAPPPPWVQR